MAQIYMGEGRRVILQSLLETFLLDHIQISTRFWFLEIASHEILAASVELLVPFGKRYSNAATAHEIESSVVIENISHYDARCKLTCPFFLYSAVSQEFVLQTGPNGRYGPPYLHYY